METGEIYPDESKIAITFKDFLRKLVENLKTDTNFKHVSKSHQEDPVLPSIEKLLNILVQKTLKQGRKIEV